ncbi:hypothetical protein [Nitrospira sp. KM1]|uniref:hypothetical protein n=1 Tax=Nitrospira sp. KM1 TaxID=1936990 RepID=UPI001567C4D9|nr:hypothetical protein [Nitrospira sp. KM1]
MMTTERSVVTKERLMDLERTVDALHVRLRDMQWELRRAKPSSLTERLWRNLVSSRQSNEFMSAVCNRRVRPNTKVVEHGHTRH